MSEKRISWIDTAKAIGICLVIFGHSYGCWTQAWLYGFHMPLFFFLAGLTLKTVSINTYLIKKCRTILFPYLAYAIIRFCWIAGQEIIRNHGFNSSIIKQLLGILLCWRNTGYTVGLWFLPLLFVSELIVIAIVTHIARKRYRDFIMGFLLMLGFSYSVLVNQSLPWGIDAALVAAPFVYLGFRCKECLLGVKSTRNKVVALGTMYTLGACLYGLIGLKLGWSYLYPDMYYGRFGIQPLYLLNALLGIGFLCYFSKIIKSTKFLSLIGRNTLHIYCIHQLILDALSKLFNLLSGGNSLNNHWEAFAVDMVMLMIVLLVSLIYIYLLNIVKRIKTDVG